MPYLKALYDLKFIILHGCYKENKSKKVNEQRIDLFDDTLKALHSVIYIDFSCFCERLKRDHAIVFPTSVQCINFGFFFEISTDHMIKVANVADLKQLKLIYIELNPRRVSVQFILFRSFCNVHRYRQWRLIWLVWFGVDSKLSSECILSKLQRSGRLMEV